MGKENDTGKRLSLGQRVQNLERKVSKQERELKKRSCGEDDHYLRFVGREVSLNSRGQDRQTVTLKEVGRFTILVEDSTGCEKVLNKSLVHSVTPTEG